MARALRWPFVFLTRRPRPLPPSHYDKEPAVVILHQINHTNVQSVFFCCQLWLHCFFYFYFFWQEWLGLFTVAGVASYFNLYLCTDYLWCPRFCVDTFWTFFYCFAVAFRSGLLWGVFVILISSLISIGGIFVSIIIYYLYLWFVFSKMILCLKFLIRDISFYRHNIEACREGLRMRA